MRVSGCSMSSHVMIWKETWWAWLISHVTAVVSLTAMRLWKPAVLVGLVGTRGVLRSMVRWYISTCLQWLKPSMYLLLSARWTTFRSFLGFLFLNAVQRRNVSDVDAACFLVTNVSLNCANARGIFVTFGRLTFKGETWIKVSISVFFCLVSVTGVSWLSYFSSDPVNLANNLCW